MQDEPMTYYAMWLEKAHEDEVSLGPVLREGSPSTACFLAQQMAEKLLKALIVFYGKEFPKTHDLSVLMKLLGENAADITLIEGDLKFLNEFYTESRYADDYHIFSKKDADQAFMRAMEVKNFVVGKLKEIGK